MSEAEDALLRRLREVCATAIPLPGGGATSLRHSRLFAIGREDLSLAKLAEAHFDAVAILAEAGRSAVTGAIYGVWASEVPGQALTLQGGKLSGIKPFCSGGGLMDRALVTAEGPEAVLVEVDLRRQGEAVRFDCSMWQTEAFRATQTGSATFTDAAVEADAVVGDPGFYLSRPGFWHGACGPAACWAGGVAGLVDFADRSKRDDPHTLAHLAAMHTNVWSMQALLKQAGDEIDTDPVDAAAAHARALKLRHSIEQLGTDTLRRFARAYGPHPLAMNGSTARRYQEADLFLRQSHGERDLETLGRLLREHSLQSQNER